MIGSRTVEAKGRSRMQIARIAKRAYTQVEVIIAMTLFAIGGSGVIAMQRTTVQGNYDARTLDVATNIGRLWLERLRREASFWTEPPAPPNTLQWLNPSNPYFASVATTTLPDFAVPAYPGTPQTSPAFDLLGAELTAANARGPDTRAVFCTRIRLHQVSRTLIRAETQVIWLRNGGTLSCDTGFIYNPDLHRSVSATSMLRGAF
jgi:Tfp pilus assembly protein PilV